MVTDPKRMDPAQALDAFLEPAKAGATDEWLAEQTDLSIRQVRAWKQRKGLTTPPPAHGTLQALKGLSDLYQPAVHLAESAALTFAAPEYVIRQELNYDGFARACHALVQEHAWTPIQVASALGVRHTDVETALSAWRRHLSLHGTKCPGCNARIDRRYDHACCRKCLDHAITR